MNVRKLKKIIEVAGGKSPADLVIRNCRIVDPISQTVSEGSIGVYDGFIIGIGDYEGKRVVDGEGCFAVAGLIDSHVHIESSMCTPEAYGSLVVPMGTTCVIADPHEICNVRGVSGLRFMMNSSERTPLKVKFMIPSCVPATEFEDSGAVLDSEKIEELIGEPKILGLGEMMNSTGVINCNEEVLEKITSAINKSKIIDGHGPMLKGKSLNAYRVSGVLTDHECSTPEEVRDRLKRGMYVLLREGSAARNLANLLEAVNDGNSRRCAMCSDDKHPEDIIANGHINHNLKIAVREGVNVFSAIAMATINAAECYKLKNTGLIAPGYMADIVLFKDLKDFEAKMVFINGEPVAKDGKALFPLVNRVDKAVTHSVNIRPVTSSDLKIPLKKDMVRVIGLDKYSLNTVLQKRKVKIVQGCFEVSTDADIKKLFVIERHNATGKIGKALIENYGIRNGAIGTTIAHDSHNIIVSGDNDRDILAAIRELENAGGGITLVKDGTVIETLSLPIGGIMSDMDAFSVSKKMERMKKTAHEELNVSTDVDPFMTLSFLALPVIPSLKVTPRGLFDVDKFDFVPMEWEE